MNATCPICGLDLTNRRYYDEVGTVEYHHECYEGCELYEEHFSYGAHSWVVGHHHFGFHTTDDSDHERIHALVRRACRLLARRRHEELEALRNLKELMASYLYERDGNAIKVSDRCCMIVPDNCDISVTACERSNATHVRLEVTDDEEECR